MDKIGHIEISKINIEVKDPVNQNSVAIEISNSIEFKDSLQEYDEIYLKQLRTKAKNSWLNNIDSESWLKQIREGYEL